MSFLTRRTQGQFWPNASEKLRLLLLSWGIPLSGTKLLSLDNKLIIADSTPGIQLVPVDYCLLREKTVETNPHCICIELYFCSLLTGTFTVTNWHHFRKTCSRDWLHYRNCKNRHTDTQETERDEQREREREREREKEGGRDGSVTCDLLVHAKTKGQQDTPHYIHPESAHTWSLTCCLGADNLTHYGMHIA